MLLVAFSAASMLGVVQVAQATTVIAITTSNGSSVCLTAPLSGGWNATTDTCSIQGTLTIALGITLDVGTGVTITATGPDAQVAGDGIDNAGNITVDNGGTITATGGNSPDFGYGGQGIATSGTIDNGGTITGIGGDVPGAGEGGGSGIQNTGAGTINNQGTMAGTSSGYSGGAGIDNEATMYNQGSVTCYGNGDGLVNGGTIYILGSLSCNAYGYGIFNGGGIYNQGSMTTTGTYANILNLGTIDDYCGGTLTGATPNQTYPCYTVTFAQSGIPQTGAVWGVTVTWPFGTTDYAGTGASIGVSNIGGPIAYSYDSPVTASGTIYECDSGCSGTPSVSSPTTYPATFAAFVVPPPAVTQNPADVGQSVTFTASPSGGSGAYTTYAWAGLPTGCAASDSPTVTCSPSTTTGSPFSVTVAVTDSNGITVESQALTFAVDPALSAGVLSSSAGTIVLVGQQTTLSTSGATGGSGTYAYAWSNLPPGCSGSDSESITCTPTDDSGSPYTVSLTVTDSNGNTAATTLTLVVQNPQQAVQSLISAVDGMNLPQGTAQSLDAKLNAATASLSSGNTNAAANQLNAFINAVNAQAGKKITLSQAGILVAQAQIIIFALQS